MPLKIIHKTGQGAPSLGDLQDGEQAYDAENGVLYVRLDGKLFFQEMTQIEVLELFTWGSNQNFRTAQGTTSGSTQTPAIIPTQRSWKSVATAAVGATLAIAEDGTLWSWGNNTRGVTGQGTASGNTEEPTQVGTDTDWLQVSAGSSNAAAIKEDGTLWSWGANDFGATGLGTSTGDATTPTQVGSDDDWKQVSCGGERMMAVKDDGTLWGTGSNAGTALGIGFVGDVDVMTQVGTDTDWSKVSSGLTQNGAGIKEDGKLFVWGSRNQFVTGQGFSDGQTGDPVQLGAADWSDISVGGAPNWGYCLGIQSDGTLWSWGTNANGRTGRGTTVGQTTTPTQVGSDDNWKSIHGGKLGDLCSSLGLKEDGTLWSWGSNNNGQTALGTSSGNTTSPAQVGSDTDWRVVDMGGTHAIALKG